MKRSELKQLVKEVIEEASGFVNPKAMPGGSHIEDDLFFAERLEIDTAILRKLREIENEEYDEVEGILEDLQEIYGSADGTVATDGLAKAVIGAFIRSQESLIENWKSELGE